MQTGRVVKVSSSAEDVCVFPGVDEISLPEATLYRYKKWKHSNYGYLMSVSLSCPLAAVSVKTGANQMTSTRMKVCKLKLVEPR